MILGVGVDVVDVAAFREQLADAASRFATGVFTIGERQAAASRASGDAARHLAARFAAKEAFVKAWSTARFGRPPGANHSVVCGPVMKSSAALWRPVALETSRPLSNPCRDHRA